jgi:hypothetical protein
MVLKKILTAVPAKCGSMYVSGLSAGGDCSFADAEC